LDFPTCAYFFCIQFSRCKGRLHSFVFTWLSLQGSISVRFVWLIGRVQNIRASRRGRQLNAIFPNASLR